MSFHRAARFMKEYLTTVLSLACAALIAIIFVIKGGDNTQHQNDVSAITDFSNRLDSAQVNLASCNGTILTLSNRLAQSESASVALANQLAQAQSDAGLDADQITNLSRQVTEVGSENQTLTRSVMDLTNQIAGLTAQIAIAGTHLNQAAKNYALLEVRLRQDVAERVVVERKFNNLFELQDQMQYLKKHPAGVISADNIYADLGIEVTSNTFHVISPN